MTTKEDAFKKILEELQKEPITSAFIVSREGTLVESVGFRDIYAETFAAMCATMFGAGETANLELEREEPEYVFLKSVEGTIFITTAGEEHILALVSSGFVEPEEVLRIVKKAVKEIIALSG